MQEGPKLFQACVTWGIGATDPNRKVRSNTLTFKFIFK